MVNIKKFAGHIFAFFHASNYETYQTDTIFPRTHKFILQ